MDFAVSSPLVPYGRLLFGFCPSTRTFVPCFLRTSPRGDSPCTITRPSPPSGRPEDFHLQVTEHAQHTTKPMTRRSRGAYLWVLDARFAICSSRRWVGRSCKANQSELG